MPQMPQKGIWVSLRLIWLSRFYYFLLRFLRETTNPLADAADAAERYMGLTQIDLIKQILLFSSAISARNHQSSRRRRRLRRKVYGSHTDWFDYSDLLFSSAVSARNYQSSRRWRWCRRKGIWVSHRLIWLFRYIFSSAGSAISARNSSSSRRCRRRRRKVYGSHSDWFDYSDIYFLLRFLRDTPLPLADGADAAERYMGLTQIDLIKQILLFSSAISARNHQSSRRCRRCRRKVYGSHSDWFD